MNLEEQIYIRKSCRNYLDDVVDFSLIDQFMPQIKPLNDSIKYYYEILTVDDVNLRTRWSAPYYLAIYSEKKDNYLENIGFVFQQLSLYLQSIGIGSCWVGMASPKKKSDDFVIFMAFGKSDDMTRDADEFKRKRICEISDSRDKKLKPARFAPSAINSQPWFFKHFNDEIHVFQSKQSLLKRKFLKKLNPIDVGIALAHLYMANQDTFTFYRKEGVEYSDKKYIGTIKI